MTVSESAGQRVYDRPGTPVYIRCRPCKGTGRMCGLKCWSCGGRRVEVYRAERLEAFCPGASVVDVFTRAEWVLEKVRRDGVAILRSCVTGREGQMNAGVARWVSTVRADYAETWAMPFVVGSVL